MGNKQKSSKKKPPINPDIKTIENEDRSSASIKKITINDASEDYIVIPQEPTNKYTHDSKFNFNKKNSFRNTVSLSKNETSECEVDENLLDILVFEVPENSFPQKFSHINKLKNSNFWIDLLTGSPSNDKCPNLYTMSLNKLHLIAEVFEFQKFICPEFMIANSKYLFEQNQSGDSPFHLIFKKVHSPSRINSILPILLAFAKKENTLFIRNRRGENILHCLLQNQNLSVPNKASIIYCFKKNCNEEEFNELILQENLNDEIPYIYAIFNKTDQDNNYWKLLGELAPAGGFWTICERMRMHLKINENEMLDFFVLNRGYHKSLEDYYDFVYIYNVNICKSLFIANKLEILLRYYKLGFLKLNIFVSYMFPLKSKNIPKCSSHFLEILLNYENQNDENYIQIVENIIKEFYFSFSSLLKRVKETKNLFFVESFKENIYIYFSRMFSNQILSHLNKNNPKLEIVISHFNLFEKLLHLIYGTLVFSKKECETRKLIKEIHFNLIDYIMRKTINGSQKKAVYQGLLNLIHQLEKFFPERDLGIIVIDFLDYSLQNYKSNESFFKKLLKKYLRFIVNSLHPSYFVDLIDDIFCFFNKNRNKNYLKGIKATPLFILRLYMDKLSLDASSLKIDESFLIVTIYESVKLNKSNILNMLIKLDQFSLYGIYAEKTLMKPNENNEKESYIIRKSGVDFYTSENDYRISLKKSKKSLYEIALKHGFFKIIAVLLEWESHKVKEFPPERLKVFKFLAKKGFFKLLPTSIIQKFSCNFKDFWLDGTISDMKMIWKNVFNLSPSDFKFKFIKTSNIKEILKAKISDSCLYELLKSLRIEVNDIKDDFLLMNENINGIEILIDKRYFRSLKFLLDNYLINFGEESKSEIFMNIFNKRSKFNGGYSLFEVLILENEFRFFLQYKKRILFEKIDLQKLSPYEKDSKFNFVFSNQIQKFFFFCIILDVTDHSIMVNLYNALMKTFNKMNILPTILSFLLFTMKHDDDFSKNEVLRVLDLVRVNKFSQYSIENVLKHRQETYKKAHALKYVLSEEQFIFENSLCCFRYQITHFLKYIEETINFIQGDHKKTLKQILNSSKNLMNFENDSILVDSSWVDFQKFQQVKELTPLEKLLLLIDINYLELTYGYFIRNVSDITNNSCYFKLIVLEKDFKGSKDLVYNENDEETNEPLIKINCQLIQNDEGFYDYLKLMPYIEEYKLW